MILDAAKCFDLVRKTCVRTSSNKIRTNKIRPKQFDRLILPFSLHRHQPLKSGLFQFLFHCEQINNTPGPNPIKIFSAKIIATLK